MFDFITQLDYSILVFIQEFLRFDWLTGPMVFVSRLGDSGFIWILLCLILLIPKKTRKIGICAIAALAIGVLITNIGLKNAVGRIRPYDQFQDLILLVDAQHDFSFPSGHSCSSFAAAYAVYLSLDKGKKKWGVLLLIFAGWIAWSRLYVAVHFPTDVIVGILVGLFSAWAAFKLLNWYQNHRQFVEKSEIND